MAGKKLSKLELQIMEKLWALGPSSIREIQEAFPEKDRPGYTTIQMTLSRMEVKKIVRRSKKVANYHIFEPLVSREDAQQRSRVAISCDIETIAERLPESTLPPGAYARVTVRDNGRGIES